MERSPKIEGRLETLQQGKCVAEENGRRKKGPRHPIPVAADGALSTDNSGDSDELDARNQQELKIFGASAGI